MMNPKAHSTFVAIAALAMIPTVVAIAEDFEVTWWTIDGGGVMFSTGGDFELSGTIGQPDAGVMGDGVFTLSGGFWFEQPPGDCNNTGGVNLLDFDDFESCLSGPEGGLLRAECNCFDIDNDTDVDLSDAAQFQQSFTGG